MRRAPGCLLAALAAAGLGAPAAGAATPPGGRLVVPAPGDAAIFQAAVRSGTAHADRPRLAISGLRAPGTVVLGGVKAAAAAGEWNVILIVARRPTTTATTGGRARWRLVPAAGDRLAPAGPRRWLGHVVTAAYAPGTLAALESLRRSRAFDPVRIRARSGYSARTAFLGLRDLGAAAQLRLIPIARALAFLAGGRLPPLPALEGPQSAAGAALDVAVTHGPPFGGVVTVCADVAVSPPGTAAVTALFRRDGRPDADLDVVGLRADGRGRERFEAFLDSPYTLRVGATVGGTALSRTVASLGPEVPEASCPRLPPPFP